MREILSLNQDRVSFNPLFSLKYHTEPTVSFSIAYRVAEFLSNALFKFQL